MKLRGMKARHAVLVATGTVMACSLGLAGVGATSATVPAGHIHGGEPWTFEVKNGFCEHEAMEGDTTFIATDPQYYGDEGNWYGGLTTVTMSWKEGPNRGLAFSGTFHKHGRDFKGTVSYKGAATGPGKLVPGDVSDC